MTPARAGQYAQLGVALAAIIAVTFLCAIGKLDATSTLLVIMGSGGISAMGSANSRLADVTTHAVSSPTEEAPPCPDYDPNAPPPKGR
jgi:hypothetical protein